MFTRNDGPLPYDGTEIARINAARNEQAVREAVRRQDAAAGPNADEYAATAGGFLIIRRRSHSAAIPGQK